MKAVAAIRGWTDRYGRSTHTIILAGGNASSRLDSRPADRRERPEAKIGDNWSMSTPTTSDTCGRQLRSLRLSVTDRCNLRCQYCMPEEEYVWLPRRDILTFEETSALVDIFVSLGVDRVRITGGEPLLRKDLAQLVALLADKPAITDLALTTNGILLSDQAATLKAAGLHRLTVSLDTLDAATFKQLTRFDALGQVVSGFDAAAAAGFSNLKIDTVVIRGVNDHELTDLIEFGAARSAEVRFIEYMDVGGATQWADQKVVSRADIITQLEARYGVIEPVDEQTSAPADRYRLPDGTTFGIISSTTQPFCSTCDRSRLTADGIWYLCLYAQSGTDLRKPLRNGMPTAQLRDLLRSTWTARTDRGAEVRLSTAGRQAFVPVETLQKRPHLEMHTRGG